ncbi:Brix domain-containing protein [Sphaerosporella brunnea]|uniref:Ribosome production factor 2 homolog n=1 Tax=Sphaerosporella brunnea TaxID=1250544 RepID=A0A5J5FC64_9PEZI|nr:Brix domain-containing protein [Sphaerosporella brunnea]
MIRIGKPRNARSKRALAERDPKLIENQKTTLILRGTSASETIQSVLTDLHALKKPASIKFSKKNDIHPFDDHSGFDFLSGKNDASLVVLGSHSKKRPHNLTVARTFDHKVLDMLEFGVDEKTYKSLEAFKEVEKPRVGMKPLLLFSGAAWEQSDQMKRVRNFWMDFFRGENVKAVDVEGLQYVLSFLAAEEGKVHIRGSMIRTKRSGQKLPRVEVEETGPRLDLTVRREQEAQPEMWKEAIKTPFKQVTKTKKNISTDIIGDKIGRIHTGKQDLSKLQSRKMKGLKKRDIDHMDMDDATLVDEEEAAPKRARRS